MAKNRKQIIFFCATTPYVMIYKIAKEFRKNGYETILITISQYDKWDINDYKDGFDKIICSNFQIYKPNLKNSFNMLKRLPHLIMAIDKIGKLKPYLVFAIARPNYITALAMKFFKKYPLIYFPYDILHHFYIESPNFLNIQTPDFELRAERYCFENADGIMHKGGPGELDSLKQKTVLGDPVKTTPLKLCFLPYCSKEFIVSINKNKLSQKDGEIHLVNVGGLLNDKRNLEIYRLLFTKLLSQRIHIHLYVKTQHLSKEEDKKNIRKGLRSFMGNKYFHIEYAFPPKKLIFEISKYNLGLWLEHYEKMNLKKSFSYPQLTTGNKISTFFEAGIPFIYTKNFVFVDRIMKKYGFNLGMDMDDFDTISKKIKKLNFKEIEKKMVRARKDFSVEKHFPRLEKFVKKVVARKKQIY